MMRSYLLLRKKVYLSITIIVFATVTILGGCSSGKNANTEAAAVEGSTDAKEAEEPTAAAEATPEATPEAVSEVVEETADESAAVSTETVSGDWTLVADNTISHVMNIGGYLNDQYGITVGYGGEIHYTNDGGKTWPNAQNNSACRFSLDIVDENLMWCGGNGGNVRVSKDGGKTWSAVTDINLGGMHSCIDFLDDTTGWITTSIKIAATKDGGQTWTELTLPEEAKGIGTVCLRTPEDGYLLSNNGLLFITSDGGTTWTKHDLGFDRYGLIADMKGTPGLFKSNTALADISFTDENNGIMVFAGTKPGEGNITWCLRTTDGGNTWDSELFPTVEDYSVTRVFLSNDGEYLTLGDNVNRIMVYKHNK